MCLNPKYNIKRRLLALPGKNRENKYKLCIELDVSESCLDQWTNIEQQHRRSIPSDALFIIAKFFNCSVTDLINGKASE
ncbi:MAG: hypothetical protein ACXVJE_19425 [Mucilaginibacter sp.]